MSTNQNSKAKAVSVKTKPHGAKFKSFFVPSGARAFEQIKWVQRSSKISAADGSEVFAMNSVEVPEAWSQLATDIAVSKYIRKAGVPHTGSERSVKQLVHRVAHTIRIEGEKLGGYFATPQDAEQFEEELKHLLVQQKGAFNSPVWFNLGLWHEYGIEGSGGNFRWDFAAKAAVETLNSYQYPQCSACFIQSVDDDLMSIFNLAKNEARIFKYGSGTGTNFSKLRGAMENLSGGGLSSGVMSFLEVLDRGAGATKSGGTTRRAAKMVSLDMDHPEIRDFINWKVREEKKVAALVEAGYSNDFNGEAYHTVAGQNSNNSVRVPDSFMAAIERDGEWQTTARTDGSVIATYKARELWKEVAQAAWQVADPGVQFDSTIQRWHTVANTDRINGSNPCSEFMFLDDTACNLASVNLVKFLRDDGTFDIKSYREACRIFLTAQEILVDISSYPTAQIARNSHEYRPLGLGYANLGTMLMIKGLPYDSAEARAWAGALTALMHGEAYRTSAEIAETKGAFAGYARNADVMMKVIKQHSDALFEIEREHVDADVMKAAFEVWEDVLKRGAQTGFRNAQVTVLAPTGTIGLLMDCDTTGIEPDFALVKFKKLAGGGYFKIVNQSVPKALAALGYTEKQIGEIVTYAVGAMSLEQTPYINNDELRKRGLNEDDILKISRALPSAFDLNGAVSQWVLGGDGLKRVNLTKQDLAAATVLEALGFSEAQIREASRVACGRMMLEGAPHIKKKHLAVFDCANKCGPDGERYIAPMAHVKMMAAAQPFISGAISKTVNLPHESSVDEIEAIYAESWKLGLKAVAVYRDGSKLSQPLSGSNEKKKKVEAPAAQAQGEPLLYTQKDLEEAVARAMALAPARKRKMPQKRKGVTIEAHVGGHKIFLRTGEYDDGHLGEIFIDMHKEGATLRSLLNCFAISVSMGLQYGVPLEDFVKKFTFTRFEPQGMVDHPNIRTATSLLDYVFRVLGMEYLGQTDFVHIKPSAADLAINQPHGSHLTEDEAPSQMDLPLSRAAIPENAPVFSKLTTIDEKLAGDAMDAQLSQMMGDAPMCSECGHVTVRNGSCYRCLNCGNSMGCS